MFFSKKELVRIRDALTRDIQFWRLKKHTDLVNQCEDLLDTISQWLATPIGYIRRNIREQKVFEDDTDEIEVEVIRRNFLYKKPNTLDTGKEKVLYLQSNGVAIQVSVNTLIDILKWSMAEEEQSDETKKQGESK